MGVFHYEGVGCDEHRTGETSLQGGVREKKRIQGGLSIGLGEGRGICKVGSNNEECRNDWVG